MTALVVNIVLILAVLVLVVTWAVGGTRRRRQDRRQHAEVRKLILQAFLGAASAAPAATPEPTAPAATAATASGQHLDAGSTAALLDLLEGRRPARRGLFAGLVSGPRALWTAAAQAGQSVGRRTTGQRADGIEEAGPELYREAAAELVDIHAYDPRDAYLQCRRYVDAVGAPALAALYVHSTAYSTYAEHDQVRQVVEQVTGAAQPPEVSDDAATIDT